MTHSISPNYDPKGLEAYYTNYETGDAHASYTNSSRSTGRSSVEAAGRRRPSGQSFNASGRRSRRREERQARSRV